MARYRAAAVWHRGICSGGTELEEKKRCLAEREARHAWLFGGGGLSKFVLIRGSKKDDG